MTVAAHAVLVVDDDPQLRRLLRTTLAAQGFRVIEAETAKRGLIEAASHKPDLVILDLGLPDAEGHTVVRGIREWSSMPIVVLSARVDEQQKIAALDAGADDYVTKPFGMDELLARMRVALRRAAPPSTDESPEIDTAHFHLDLAAKRATVGDREVRLTPIEWGLVELLVRNPGRLLTQGYLLQRVWGPQYEQETGYLRVHLAHIRRKLEPDPSRPRYFVTEPGMGYRFEPDR